MLEPVAERVFGELPYDVFLVEWDDVALEGGYEPTDPPPEAGRRHGSRQLEAARAGARDHVLRRLEEASRHLPLEQLALSTQCGFASVLEGNEIDEDTQWRKLEVVARVADRVWPR